jgi:hypothetical protein
MAAPHEGSELSAALPDVTVQTEADVEQKVIYPLLTAGIFLEIPERHIKAKSYLAPTKLDKVAGRTAGYYPDYSVWEMAFPVLIVEAKSPDVPAEVGYREASLYARHLNQEFKPKLNPCMYVIASNGEDFLVGTWDAKPVLMFKREELHVGSPTVQKLRDLCHYRVLVEHAALCLQQVKIGVGVRPFNMAGGQALINSRKPLNTFAADLSPVMRRYFTSTSQNDEREIYERAYVSTDEAAAYDRILESLLKDRIPTLRGSLTDAIKVTSSGFIHMRILSERLEYLYGVLASTPVFDLELASYIAGGLTAESRLGDLNGHQKARYVGAFVRYLRGLQEHLARLSPRFGGADTGASYVIAQADAALQGYRRSGPRGSRLNPLDN